MRGQWGAAPKLGGCPPPPQYRREDKGRKIIRGD